LAVDEGSLLRLCKGWRDKAIRRQAGPPDERITVAGRSWRDGLGLARGYGRTTLKGMHSHDERSVFARAPDAGEDGRLDTEIMKRAFLDASR